MQKLIIFDWGDVLLDMNSNKYSIFNARKDIALELCPNNSDDFMKMFDGNEFWTLSEEKLNCFIQKSLIHSKCEHSVEDFKECYLRHYKKVPWYEEMKVLFTKLSNDTKTCVGILSTLCEMDLQLLKEALPLDKVDFKFFSFNLGVQKPSVEIYKIVEIVTGYDVKNILFIDDLENNIEVANSLGWNTLLATGKDFNKIKGICYEFVRDCGRSNI